METQIHAIHLPTWVSIYVIQTESGCVLLDTGTVWDVKRVAEAVEALGAKPDLIFLTHIHVDHAGAASDLRARWACPIAVPEGEADWARRGYRRVPKPMDFGIMLGRPFLCMCPVPKQPAFEPDLVYGDGWSLAEFGVEAVTVSSPGHSPDHHALHMGEVLFCGDAVAGAARRPDDPRLSMFGEEKAQMKASANRLAGLDAERVLPCHGRPFSMAALRKWAGSIK